MIKNKKIDKFVHQDSGLVFKSEKEKNVIGKLHEDKIKELSDEDIDNCKKYGFKYEIEKVTNKEELEEEPDDEELEEDELDEEKISIMKKISRKITGIPQQLEAKDTTSIKKSIKKAISNTNAQADDVEEILKNLNIQGNEESDSEDEFEEHEFEEDMEEEY